MKRKTWFQKIIHDTYEDCTATSDFFKTAIITLSIMISIMTTSKVIIARLDKV